MADCSDIKRYLANLEDERSSATLYRIMAEHEKNTKISEVYRRLAKTEEAHAATWAQKLSDSGVDAPPFCLSMRNRALIWLIKRFGVTMVLPSLTAIERNGTRSYCIQPEANDMLPEEQSHVRLLKQIGKAAGGVEGSALARFEGRHRSAGGNALRAAVLGASDGLLSNFNLIMGVAGASLSSGAILVTGFAGLLAGAISMALGEWISVRSSQELYEKQLSTEKEEIDTAPDEEVEELALIYQARGMDEETARKIANQLISNPSTALDALARDELGIDPEELGGSAWEAAITSFFLFAAGAFVPVLPFLLTSGTTAVIASACLSAFGLFVIGAAITLFTGKSVLYSGLRQVIFGLAAAGAVFLIGHLIGASISS